MIGVEDDAGPVPLSHVADVEGARDATVAGRLDAAAVALAGHECGAAVRELDDRRRVHLRGGLHHTVHRVRPDAVGSGEGEAVRLRVREEFGDGVACEDTRGKFGL